MVHSGRVAGLQGQQAGEEVVAFEEVATDGDIVVHSEDVGRLNIGQLFENLQILAVVAAVRKDVGRMQRIDQRVAVVLDYARVAEIQQ